MSAEKLDKVMHTFYEALSKLDSKGEKSGSKEPRQSFSDVKTRKSSFDSSISTGK